MLLSTMALFSKTRFSVVNKFNQLSVKIFKKLCLMPFDNKGYDFVSHCLYFVINLPLENNWQKTIKNIKTLIHLLSFLVNLLNGKLNRSPM